MRNDDSPKQAKIAVEIERESISVSEEPQPI